MAAHECPHTMTSRTRDPVASSSGRRRPRGRRRLVGVPRHEVADVADDEQESPGTDANVGRHAAVCATDQERVGACESASGKGLRVAFGPRAAELGDAPEDFFTAASIAGDSHRGAADDRFRRTPLRPLLGRVGPRVLQN
jgi:hypothetical protein